MNKRKIGEEYETLAVEYLQCNEYEIIERNFRCRLGEIDIIARDKSGDDIFLTFIEVKFRKNLNAGNPFEAVNLKKQMIIRKVARYYLISKGYEDNIKIRFDVVGIIGDKIEIIKNAF